MVVAVHSFVQRAAAVCLQRAAASSPALPGFVTGLRCDHSLGARAHEYLNLRFGAASMASRLPAGLLTAVAGHEAMFFFPSPVYCSTI